MNTIENSFKVRHEEGFAVYVLSNQKVEIAVVPELGAKIISLKNLETGREWMWHPPGGLKLFRNRPDDDFSKSPLVGVDECLPTIAPCSWRGRDLPDHGELWNTPWSVDHMAWKGGVLRPPPGWAFRRFNWSGRLNCKTTTSAASITLTARA